MRTYTQRIVHNDTGFTLLLMVVLLAVFLSIAMGIINILLGQVIIVEQAGESSKALYAADIGMERTLYRDLVQHVCNIAPDCSTSGFVSLPNGACYEVDVDFGPSIDCVSPSTRCINVTGQNICGGVERFVRRKFNVQY